MFAGQRDTSEREEEPTWAFSLDPYIRVGMASWRASWATMVLRLFKMCVMSESCDLQLLSEQTLFKGMV